MKKMLFKTTLLILISLIANSAQSQPSLFVRVYDLNGKKIYKGIVTNVTDSNIQLNFSETNISVKNIGAIRTKHSFGHNILVSTGITSLAFVTLFVATSQDKSGFISWTPLEGIAIGLLSGAIYGPVIGAGSTLFKNSIEFPINGSEKNWKEFYRLYNGTN